MLREVKNEHLSPRIVPFKITTTVTPTATIDIGTGDFTLARSAAGRTTLTLKRPFARNCVVVCNQATSAGYYSANDVTTGSSSVISLAMVDNGGNYIDGAIEGVIFGWDSSDVNLVREQHVLSSQDAPRLIWGKVASTGTVSIGSSDFSVTKTGTGVYAVTFKRAFARTPVVVGMQIGATALSTYVSNESATGATLTFADRTPTATDTAFYIMACGTDCRSDTWGRNTPLQNSQRKLQIVAAEVTNTSGAWTKSIGSVDFGAVTDVGVGDFSMTIASGTVVPAREIAIFAHTTGQQAIVAEAGASALVHVKTLNGLGNAADADGVTQILAIASQDASEY